MSKKRIVALGILVAVISVTGIVIFNNNENGTVEAVALVETDGDIGEREDRAVTTVALSEPIKEEAIEEVKEDKKGIGTGDNTEDTEITIESTVEDTDNSDIEALDKTMYAQGNVNTRSGPSKEFEKVGGLSVNQEVHITGQSKSTKWYEIEINGEKQYVSNQFLADTKIQVTTPPASTGNSGSTDTTDNSGSTDNTGNSGSSVNENISASDQAILDALGATDASSGWTSGDVDWGAEHSSGAGIHAH